MGNLGVSKGGTTRPRRTRSEARVKGMMLVER